MTSGASRLLDIVDRTRDGPPCKAKDFDLRVLPANVQELEKEYKIKYDPDRPVPNDNALADALFQAGLRLFLDVGILCTDTERRITFTENEVKEALRDQPGRVLVGQGRDAREMYCRKIEDTAPPRNVWRPSWRDAGSRPPICGRYDEHGERTDDIDDGVWITELHRGATYNNRVAGRSSCCSLRVAVDARSRSPRRTTRHAPRRQFGTVSGRRNRELGPNLSISTDGRTERMPTHKPKNRLQPAKQSKTLPRLLDFHLRLS